MTTEDMARKLVTQAAFRMTLVKSALGAGQWAYVVRESQEAVELALKGALRSAGIEPPRWHDVGDVIAANLQRLPPALFREAGRLRAISRELREDRETAFYGDEQAQLAPEDIYGESDARDAYAQARFVVDLVEQSVLGTAP